MYPRYQQRNVGGEIAIWLLITLGALLIPLIGIAICCIRRQYRGYFSRSVFLAKKTTHQTHGRAVSTYEDDAEAVGGSTFV